MKKILLVITCAVAATGSVFAAGNFRWDTISFAAMTAQTNSTQYSPLFGGGSAVGGSVGAAGGSASLGTGFYYELLYTSYSGVQASITSLSSLLAWSDSGLGATNSNTAGRLTTIDGNAGAQVPWSPGTTNSVVMIGWSANLGTSWAAVSNVLANWSTYQNTIVGAAYVGISSTGYLTPLSTSTSPGTVVFGSSDLGQGLPIYSLNTQLYLLPVPEPSTIALAGLGAASLLLFRRRK